MLSMIWMLVASNYLTSLAMNLQIASIGDEATSALVPEMIGMYSDVMKKLARWLYQ